MANETKYPARGRQSDDGNYITSMTGNVFDTRLDPGSKPVGYVPSADEQAACEMARAMISTCQKRISCARCTGIPNRTCKTCSLLRTCPARAYLAANGDAKAWEVAT